LDTCCSPCKAGVLLEPHRLAVQCPVGSVQRSDMLLSRPPERPAWTPSCVVLKNSYLVAVEAQLPPLAASGPEADHLTPWCLVPGDLKFARGIVILLVFTPAGSLMVYAVHGAPLSALLCSLPTVKSVAPMICKFQPTTCNTSTSVCSCSVMADCANEYATYRAAIT
jgi:hypothetical protein